ncbi:MAG: DNA-3-methyladenine glycosylase [Rickettsiales bacterium]|jgi:DNA-3-methyladenine glycosylase II|nr:DNA-3-methyladenine glycosylase [Rickettsiales bacterium]
MKPDYWPRAKQHLSKNDPTLKSIIAAYHGEALTLRGDAFYTLARSIAGQQISVKAADSIWARFEKSAKKITPASIQKLDIQTMRACGFSASKASYMHALAEHFVENKKLIAAWPEMDDEAIIQELVAIKGIGRWSAEMFLIFGLGRPDVFPVLDIGLQKAVARYYHEGARLKPKELMAYGERWRPYRSVATWYLWRALDPVPVAY